MKISIIGYSGSGKSTLAKSLGEMFNCPVLYLDTVQFEPGWKERDRDEAKSMVKNFMNQDRWVIDGNYTGFYFTERLTLADKIIFLNFPRLVCLYRVFKRYFQNKGKSRESMAAGCIEKIDWEFVKWVLSNGRTKKIQDRFKEVINTYGNKVIVLKNKKDVSRFLANIKHNTNQ